MNLCRERENLSLRNIDLKVLSFCFEDYFSDDELMSTGIVSLKEGYDESHINDTKLKTKFWNDVNEVTIRLTQNY